MNRLFARRVHLGLSQAQLAEKSGVSRQTIGKADSGGSLHPIKAALLAEALGCSLEQLFEIRGGMAYPLAAEPSEAVL